MFWLPRKSHAQCKAKHTVGLGQKAVDRLKPAFRLMVRPVCPSEHHVQCQVVSAMSKVSGGECHVQVSGGERHVQVSGSECHMRCQVGSAGVSSALAEEQMHGRGVTCVILR